MFKLWQACKEITYHQDYPSPRWVCAFALWGSVGSNAASHYPRRQPVPNHSAVVPSGSGCKRNTAGHSQNADTLVYCSHASSQCLSLILLPEGLFLPFGLDVLFFSSFFSSFTHHHNLAHQLECFLWISFVMVKRCLNGLVEGRQNAKGHWPNFVSIAWSGRFAAKSEDSNLFKGR